MHFKDDPISDMHAKNYLIISCLKHFPGPTKFGPVFWSRLFRRGPVEYNYPVKTFSKWRSLNSVTCVLRHQFSLVILCMKNKAPQVTIDLKNSRN